MQPGQQQAERCWRSGGRTSFLEGKGRAGNVRYRPNPKRLGEGAGGRRRASSGLAIRFACVEGLAGLARRKGAVVSGDWSLGSVLVQLLEMSGLEFSRRVSHNADLKQKKGPFPGVSQPLSPPRTETHDGVEIVGAVHGEAAEAMEKGDQNRLRNVPENGRRFFLCPCRLFRNLTNLQGTGGALKSGPRALEHANRQVRRRTSTSVFSRPVGRRTGGRSGWTGACACILRVSWQL